MTDDNSNLPELNSADDSATSSSDSKKAIFIVLALILFFVGTVGVAGYMLYQKHFNKSQQNTFVPEINDYQVSQTPIDTIETVAQLPSDTSEEIVIADLEFDDGEEPKLVDSAIEEAVSTSATTDEIQMPNFEQTSLLEDLKGQLDKLTEEINVKETTIAFQINTIAELKEELKKLKNQKTKTKTRIIYRDRPQNESAPVTKSVVAKLAKEQAEYIKTPTPPFTFIGVEIWDGTPAAVISLNGRVTQLTKGESSSNWILLNTIYPEKAQFMERTTGQKVVLLSDGRRPHDF